MSKNKSAWGIALILISIISLPIAYAQVVPTGSKIYFILINAAIIFVLLFILQSFLIQGKSDKEKTSVWVIMILASLLLAYFFGQNGFLWEGPLKWIFNVFILVNSAIIAAILYFVLGLLDVNKKLNSTEGKTGYGILIFLFSVMIAINIAPNMFLWQQEFVRSSFAFLFSPEKGILHPKSGLLVFVTSFILISFFFNQFLLKQGDKKLNYALALIFAVNLAIPPVNPIKDVVQMGEIIFILIVWETLKGTVPQDKPWAAFLLSILLVGWASAALTVNTPENRGAVAGMVCHTGFVNCKVAAGTAAASSGFLGMSKMTLILILIALAIFWPFGGEKGKKVSGWAIGIGLIALILLYMWSSGGGVIGKIGFGLVMLIAIIAVILYFMSRGETIKRILTLGVAGAKERINAIIKNAKFLRESPEGREPQVFRENRILFHMLANFTTRSEITYRYWGFVEQAKRVGTQILNKMGVFTYDQKTLRQDIIKARSGGVTSQGAHLDGWNKLNIEVVDLVNSYFELTFWVYVSALFNFKDRTARNFKSEINEYNRSISTSALNIEQKIETSRTHYNLMTNAFGGHHVLNAYKGIILNMTNVTGDVLEHYQKFARPDAEFEGNPRGRDIGFYGLSFKAEGRRDPQTRIILPIHEVNQFGEYIQDITDQRDKFGNLPDPRDYKKPRKVKPEDIIDYPDYTTLMANVELDWKGLAEDIRYGLWHPESRTFQMYAQSLSKAIYPEWADEQIPIVGATGRIESSPSTGDEAFDMRALANPGLHPYWGRKTFDAEAPPGKNDPFHNPFPGVSSLGLVKYLEERVGLDMKDKAKAQEFMNKYHRDSAAPKKVTVRGEVKVKIGTRLGLTQQETQG